LAAYQLMHVVIFGGNLSTHALRSLFLTLLLASAALGQSPGNRTYFGEDIYVASGQQIHNATCIFCSVQVEGDLTGRVVVLFGSLNLSGRVEGGATVVGGNAVVDSQARVGGDTVVLGGNAVYETDESLSGSAYVVGGHLSHVVPTHGQERPHPRISLSPLISALFGIFALILLLAIVFAPRVRRHATVIQSSRLHTVPSSNNAQQKRMKPGGLILFLLCSIRIRTGSTC
jgi:hypothetical protein